MDASPLTRLLAAGTPTSNPDWHLAPRRHEQLPIPRCCDASIIVPGEPTKPSTLPLLVEAWFDTRHYHSLRTFVFDQDPWVRNPEPPKFGGKSFKVKRLIDDKLVDYSVILGREALVGPTSQKWPPDTAFASRAHWLFGFRPSIQSYIQQPYQTMFTSRARIHANRELAEASSGCSSSVCREVCDHPDSPQAL